MGKQKSMSDKDAFVPFVSVWVITFNHADFIRKCIDGILAQKTHYSFEICLGEDDSTDGTREICKEYAERYPDKIRLFLRDRDDPKREGCIGVWQYNFLETLKACKGKYIALCDGDDYWSCDEKLQKQVDWLEQHPGFSGCFHKVGQVDENDKVICSDMGYPIKRLNAYSLDYLLAYSNFSPMLSVVFRNHFDVAPDFIKKAPFGDIIIHANNLRYGDYGFIDQVMGFYRIHEGGLASGATRLHNTKATIDVYRMIGKELRVETRSSFKKGVRILRFSYVIDFTIKNLVPDFLKGIISPVFGRKFRYFLRRLILR